MNSWCLMLSVMCILLLVNGTGGNKIPHNPCKKRQRFGKIQNDKKCTKWFKSIKDTDFEIALQRMSKSGALRRISKLVLSIWG